ncbi:MAG: hypothetical protein PHH40_02695 [Candidatus Moranbacteria bacterium]|nr:hypothetical protein [Candidatus Moranbacteria bacterium]MDD3965199.1 hypothetical protein [Candidatus Moranbacteria bacterium]
MSWKIFILLGIVLFFLGCVSGSLLSVRFYSLKNSSQSNIDTNSPAYQAGFHAARKLVEGSRLWEFVNTELDDIRFIAGTVNSVEGNRIVIHSESIIGDPFSREPAINDYTVTINENTQVLRATETGSVPVPFIEISLGNTVVVTSQENIKNQPEFVAKEVQIQIPIPDELKPQL